MKNQVASVKFNNHSLVVVTKNEQRLVAMRPVCDGIGLDWKAQYNRIKRDEILNEAMVIMTIPSKGGEQSTACLPLEYLNGWLFGIDVSRCREEIRPALIQYKRECYQVLANYWQQGEAVNHRAQKALRTPLTIEQQSIIKDLVKSRVETLPPSKQAKAAITCWSALKSKFGCSYKLIESEQFSDAVSLVARLTLEGEFLGKETKHLPNLSYPIETLVSRRAGMLTVCNNKHAWLDITLHDLRDIHGDETPLEQLLGELNKAGYDIEGCWWELRTYRNKVRELANLAAGMNRAIEEPHRYAVTTNRDSL